MMLFYEIILCSLVVMLTAYLYRSLKGPSVFDRLIGLNGIATKAVLILVFIGVVFEQTDMFMDIALGFGLLNLVGALAVGKYLEKKGQHL